jgi:cation diffusion facilitator family transporter
LGEGANLKTSMSRVTWIALAVSLALTFIKFWGWRLTGSQAVYSDAMESIVNVVAGLLAIFVVYYSAKPADRGHPYGHGKIEYFSAAFEGGLITFAAVLIAAEALPALIEGRHPERLETGLAVVVGAGFVNLALGAWIYRTGRHVGSPALVANGQHIMSDFWTSAGVAVGLVAALATGWSWLDPLTALAVALQLGWTGLKVVRRSVGGLLDEEDAGIIRAVVGRLRVIDFEGVIQLHHLRIVRSGRYHHIDAHAVVPEIWNVAEAHERTQKFEQNFMQAYPQPGELHLHIDPCRRVYCRQCSWSPCSVRSHAFEAPIELNAEALIHPEEPDEYLP